MRVLALVTAALALAPAALAAQTTAPITKLALTAADIGPGYTRHVIPGGTLVQDQVTLDICGGSYPSEGLREQRLQLAFLPPAGQKTEISNEVVRYAPGGAEQGLREVKQHIAHCPKGP